MARWWMLCGLLMACSESTETVDTDEPVPTKGACGETTRWDIEVIGAVTNGEGPVEGAEVRLEERNYNAGTVHGTSVTDSDGEFVIAAIDVVSVEDCWGTLLDYHVVAESGDEIGEKKANTYLHTAIYNESLSADMRGFPVEIE